MFPLLAGLAVFVGVLAYGGIWWPVWVIGALAAAVGVMWVLVEMRRGTTVGSLLGTEGYFLAATGIFAWSGARTFASPANMVPKGEVVPSRARVAS